MFTDLELLYRQHEGRLGFAWNAGIRGIKYIPRKQLQAVNIVKSCMEIMEYIASNSKSPKKRFSLRLAAILTNGVVKIFRQQVILTQDEIVSFLCKVTIPQGMREVSVSEIGFFQTPPTPIPIVKKNKSKKPIHATPEQFLQDVEQLITNMSHEISQMQPQSARADAITIRETMPLSRQDELTQGFGEEGMALGNIQDIQSVSAKDLLRIDLPMFNPGPVQEGKSKSISSPETSVQPQVIVERAQVIRALDEPAPKESLILYPETVSVPPSKDVLEREVSPVAPEQPPVVPEQTFVVPDIVLPIETEIAPAPATIVESETAKARKQLRLQYRLSPIATPIKKDTKVNEHFVNITRHPARYIPINRSFLGDNVANQIFIQDLCPRIGVKISSEFTLVNLLPFMYSEDRNLSQMREGISALEARSSSLRDTTGKRRTDSTQTPTFGSTDRLDVPSTPFTSTPILSKRGREAAEEISDIEHLAKKTKSIVQPLIIKEMQVPIKEPMVTYELEVPVEKPITPEEYIIAIEEPMVTQIPESTPQSMIEKIQYQKREKAVKPSQIMDKELIRHTKIVDIVKNWDSEEKGFLSLEEIAEKPLRKLTVARAFSDVLFLCKNGYVTLVAEEDSIQLKSIEKGPKLISL